MKKREFSRARGAPTRTHCTGRVFPLIGGGDVFAPNTSRSMGHVFAHIAQIIISHVFQQHL